MKRDSFSKVIMVLTTVMVVLSFSVYYSACGSVGSMEGACRQRYEKSGGGFYYWCSQSTEESCWDRWSASGWVEGETCSSLGYTVNCGGGNWAYVLGDCP